LKQPGGGASTTEEAEEEATEGTEEEEEEKEDDEKEEEGGLNGVFSGAVGDCFFLRLFLPFASSIATTAATLPPCCFVA